MKHGRPDYDETIQDSSGKIPADEPVLLIRGQDEYAGRVASFYADTLESRGADPEHVKAIRRHALELRNWRPKKKPDRPDLVV